MDEIYKPLFTSYKRYFLLTGGRASLKSSSVHEFIIRLTYQKGHGILFTRYTMKSAEKSIIPEFKIVLERLNASDNFTVTSNGAVNNITGSFIMFSGIKTNSGDQTANLKSLAGITTWVIEEAEDFNDERKFDIIDDSIRTASIQNRVFLIMNPTTKEHWIYKRFIQNNSKQIDLLGHKVTVSNEPNVEHIHSSYHIAQARGFLSRSFLDKAKKIEKENPKYYYNNYIGGWLEKLEGAIYENWEEGKFDESLPFGYGLDFGFYPDPTALVKCAIDQKRKLIYLKEELYLQKLSTDDLVKNLSSICGKKIIIADSAEKRSINDLISKGISVKPCKKGPDSIINGIRNVQNYKLIITSDSNNLKKELNNYIWTEKNSKPVDDFNHLLDAVRYYTDYHIRSSSFFVK